VSKFEEKTLRSKQIYEGRVFDVRVDRVRLSNGSETGREVVVHGGGASVVALDGDKNIYLVRQWRYPFGRELLEIPAGKLDRGEEPKECALRELMEETGMRAGRLVDLGEFYATPAYCTEVLHIYLALDLEEAGQDLDDGEFLDVVKMPFDTAFKMAVRGEIRDAKTQIGLLKAFFRLNKENMNIL
jgi:ADP-ribose pyrophosphatase